MTKHRRESVEKITFFVMLAILGFATAAFAENTPSGLGAIADKVRQIRTVVRTVAGVIIGIAVIWGGVKIAKGDQDGWNFMWKVALGGVIVATAGEIVSWLGGEGF